MWVKTPTWPGLWKAKRERMETPSTRQVYSVAAIIIIPIVSKALSLKFYKKQSLKCMICSESLKNGNSARPLLPQGQVLNGCPRSLLQSLLKYYFQLVLLMEVSFSSPMRSSTRERRESLQPVGPGFIFHLWLLAFCSYQLLVFLSLFSIIK